MTPPAAFDQGLFLAHLNKGREFHEKGRFAEAERELQEAYLLRPRDERSLNLLGLIYFKQGKLEKAEEVYSKLASDNPHAATLFYNLGLIHFKLGRLEEAESDFLKSLSLGPENPKINFYLGSIYERQRRFQDAIYQYRRAGANLMVRRIEDKISAGPSSLSATAQTQPSKPPDTAELITADLTAALAERAEPGLAPKEVGPLTNLVMASHVPSAVEPVPPQPLSAGGALHRGPKTTPIRLPDLVSYQRASVVEEVPPTGHRRTTDTFRFLQSHLMEISVGAKVFIKQGTLFSYSGNLTFWAKERRAHGVPTLVIVTGQGRIMLADMGREITFMHLDKQTICVEPDHLLACEDSLAPRYVAVTESAPKVAFVVLEGTGFVALSLLSKPIAMSVTPDLPIAVPSASVILWSGTLKPQIIQDPELLEAMAPVLGTDQRLLRLEGLGTVLAEQALR